MKKNLTADFSKGNEKAYVRGLYQHDYGAILKVTGIEYAEIIRVDFAGSNDGKAHPVVALQEPDGSFQVKIPKENTDKAGELSAYIYITDAESGFTIKEVILPITERVEADPDPSGEKTDPFADVADVIEEIKKNAKSASDSAASAAESEKSASESATQAEKSAVQSWKAVEAAAISEKAAATSAMAAAESERQAEEFATTARSAGDQAAKSATAAAESATDAAKRSQSAEQSATNASGSAESASQSAETAKTAADTAEKSASAAQQASRSATESASTATAAAQTATTAAGKAAESATTANQSAETAGQKAIAAETAAGSAAESETEAAKSATAAGDSASAAKTSETAAEEAAQTAQEQAEKIKASAEQIEKNKTDVTSLKEDTAALQKRQNILVGSETGNPVSCDDAFAAPLCGLYVYGKSTQDGTPSPDNPVPIISAGDGGSVAVRVTGKNMLNPALFQDNKYQSFNVNSNYYDITNSDSYWITGFQPCLPNTTYRFNVNVEGGCFYDKKKNVIGVAGFEFSIKTPAKCAYYCVNFSTLGTPYGTPVIATVSESAAYSPYCEQLLTLPTPNGLPGIHVTSGGNYTDQNGQQWVCDEVDLERGVKVQRVNAVDLSTCVITTITKFAVTKRVSIRLPLYGRDYKTEALCNKSPFFASFNKDTPHFYVDKTNVQIFIPNDAKNPEEGEYILFYTLSTPIETPLTSDEIAAYKALTAYAPDTVVQASDGAGIKLDYQRDVNLVVKNLEDAMASMTTT